jgi:hypothetical protein
MNHLGVVLLLWMLPLRSEVLPPASENWIGPAAEPSEIVLLQELTDDLRQRLEIKEQVQISLVDHNPLVMSVETLSGRTGPFVISIDRKFISELGPQEVEAAIAHELGHVWIYTHPPFVQTERKANEVALRVINRSAFAPVYEKVWQRTGIRGNLIDFLGPPAQQQ